MTFSQAVIADGTQITLPPSKLVVFWMIAAAVIAFARGRTFFAVAVLVMALLIAGTASVYNQAVGAPHDRQPSSTQVSQIRDEEVGVRPPPSAGGMPGP